MALWQLTQVALVWPCGNGVLWLLKLCGGMKWHASQAVLVTAAACRLPLRVWQLAQLPDTWLWSTRVVIQVLVVVWQASHTGGKRIRMWLAERVLAWQPASPHAALLVSLWFIWPRKGRFQRYRATASVWQLPQLGLVRGWVGLMPCAKVLLWQVAQAVGLMAWLWLKVMRGVQPPGFLLWQASQMSLVCRPMRCLPALPLAPRKVPVWQLTHRLMKLLWLVSTVVQLATPLWQLSQAAVVGMWLAGLPVLATPLPWHAAQAVAG